MNNTPNYYPWNGCGTLLLIVTAFEKSELLSHLSCKGFICSCVHQMIQKASSPSSKKIKMRENCGAFQVLRVLDSHLLLLLDSNKLVHLF